MGKIYKLTDKAGSVIYPMTIGDAIAVDGSTLTAKITTEATQSKRGMMSAADKKKLDDMPTVTTIVTGVKGNSETDYRTGQVNITPTNIGLGNVTNDKQIKGLASGTTADHVVTFGADGYTVKDSGKTIGTSVPANALFTDTTYTFAEGSENGKFSVTPKGGSATAIAIHGLAAAAYKDIDSSITDATSVKLPTSAAVAEYVEKQMVSVLKYKGTVDSTHPLPAKHAVGDVYVVAKAGTYAAQSCEVGDYIICKTAGTTASDSHWDVINGENQVVDGNVTLVWGTKSDVATVDGTTIHVTMPANPNTDTTVDSAAHHYAPTKNAAATKTAAGATGAKGTSVQVITAIETDGKGHITGIVSGATTDTTYKSKAAAASGTDESLVTTGEKAVWNAKYTKPTDGIPTTDLNSSVQTALGKANTAIQEHQSLAHLQTKITANGILKGDGNGSVSAATAGTDYLAPVTAVTDTPAATQIIKSVTQTSDGQITVTKSGYTIATSVPANAVFTDTDTKVTAVGNHYAPTKSTTESASGAKGTSGTTVQVVTGIEMDAAGHVTGVVSGAATDTTYESKAAKASGTAVSLVTTGEKATWNAKQDALTFKTAPTATNKVVTESDIIYATAVKETEYTDATILAIITA